MLQEKAVQTLRSSPCCPTCGSKISDDASWDFDLRTFFANGHEIKLTYREATIFTPIWEARNKGGIVSLPKIAELAFAHERNGGPMSMGAISDNIRRIRRRIELSGYTISGANGRAQWPYRLIKTSSPTIKERTKQ